MPTGDKSKHTVKGLVIKEQNIGEADRLVTFITPEQGRIRAFATGARNIKSSKVSATDLFCYSDFSLYRGRDTYRINNASAIEVFFGLRTDIYKMSTAQYFCELANVLVPTEEPAEEYLSLMLNAFHLIAKGDRDRRIIKSAFELRIICLAGFMPNLVGCAFCGKEPTNADAWKFLPEQGGIGCPDCTDAGTRLSGGVLAALRHIVYSEPKKIFSYRLSDENLELLSGITERYVLHHTEYHFKTLDFLHSIT